MHRDVLRLALPVLGEQLLIFFVGVFDTFLAGQISTNATAAIGVAAYVGWLASLLFSLVAIGTTALVARHWGAGEFGRANQIVNQSLPLAFFVGTGVFLLIYTIAPTIATLQNMTGEAHGIVVRYLRIDAAGQVFTSLSLVGAAALRGSGDTRTPMWVHVVVNLVNITVSPILVFGVGPFSPWGIDGIVTGTVTGRICGGLLMLGVLSSGMSGLRLLRSELYLRAEPIRRILRIGIPAAIDGMLMWVGHFLFVMIIARLGEGEQGRAIYAAHIIGIQVEALTYLPAVAWGAASATLIGQALGARDPQRAWRVGHTAVLQCMLLALVATTVYFSAAGPIYRLMHSDPTVWKEGVPALRMLAFFQIPHVMLIVYIHSLRGAGDTRYPMLFTLAGVFAVRIPLAYYCGIVLQGGLVGAWVGMLADITLRAILVTIRYTRGRWREIEV